MGLKKFGYISGLIFMSEFLGISAIVTSLLVYLMRINLLLLFKFGDPIFVLLYFLAECHSC